MHPARIAASDGAQRYERHQPEKALLYHLKTPYRDGTTDVIFEPLDFIATLAALADRVRSHAQI